MNTQVFLSARCNQAFLDDMRLVAIANDYEMPEDHHLAYALIKDKLVPECFIQRVKKQLSQTDFVFRQTLSEGEIFSGRFLASLHPAERDVLMSVVLVLIERGDIMLNVWGKME